MTTIYRLHSACAIRQRLSLDQRNRGCLPRNRRGEKTSCGVLMHYIELGQTYAQMGKNPLGPPRGIAVLHFWLFKLRWKRRPMSYLAYRVAQGSTRSS